MIYTDTESGGDILYRETALGTVALGPTHLLMAGTSLNDASSTKQTFANEVVVIATPEAGHLDVHGAVLAP